MGSITALGGYTIKVFTVGIRTTCPSCQWLQIVTFVAPFQSVKCSDPSMKCKTTFTLNQEILVEEP